MSISLVTGANGFIGSHLVERLLSEGKIVKCLVVKGSDISFLQKLNIEIFDYSEIKKAFEDVDIVYHLAGATKARTEEEYRNANFILTKNIIDSCLKFAPNIKRFIHISSQAVAGPSLNGEPVTEDMPFNPLTWYGKTKLEAENYVMSFSSKGESTSCGKNKLPVTVLRPCSVYGPREKDIYTYFKLVNNRVITFVGGKNKLMNILHCYDVVDGMILASENENAVGKIYFLSSDKAYTWEEMSETIARILKKNCIKVVVPLWGINIIANFSEFFAGAIKKPALINRQKVFEIKSDYWVCSNQKAKTELGFQQKISLEEGIRNTIEWYKKNKWL
jgi:nucleoside-diphosphate-sugar epimerase